MGHHLNEELESTLEHEGAIIGNVSENEEGIDACDIVPPCREVSDDALK